MQISKKYFIIILFVFIIVLGCFFCYQSNFKKDKIVLRSADKVEKELTDDQLKEQIGQMLMIGFRGTEVNSDSNIIKIINDVNVGGVILSNYDTPSSGKILRNIVNFNQTKKLISDLQNNVNNPLFVAVDAEGGSVNRLKEKNGFVPIVSQQEMGKDKTLETVKKESTKIAKQLKTLGFNMNLAPVVDVNVNPKNPIIGSLGRSFSSNANEVVNQSREFIQSHIKNNIIAVAKHFPGQGSGATDSHLGMVDVTNTYTQEELLPYKKLNEEGLLSAVMTAHIIDENIDSVYPATLSPLFINNILREQIGFKGVIITDDIQMGAISKNYDFDDALILAINAGCDILVVGNSSPGEYDEGTISKARDVIFNAVKSGIISEKRITDSYKRIMSLKESFGIVRSVKNVEEIKAKDFQLLGTSEKISFEKALETAKYVGGLTGIRPAFLMGILQEELSLEEFDFCYLTDFKTGVGINSKTGEKISRVMSPARDIPNFLIIAKDLNMDPSKILITCPMSFGWGGAMGPADFIPSTWVKYKKKIEAITGNPANPWNIKDAFLAAGMYLSDSGARLKTKDGEFKAAMIYFSGSANSPYTWYASGAVSLAEDIQKDIELIEKN